MFSILRESSGLTFIFINVTKQYLKRLVRSVLPESVQKSKKTG